MNIKVGDRFNIIKCNQPTTKIKIVHINLEKDTVDLEFIGDNNNWPNKWSSWVFRGDHLGSYILKKVTHHNTKLGKILYEV